MNIAQKLSFIKATAKEIVQNVEEKYRKLNDLLILCSDPKDIDVVLKSLKALCDVFCDILPTYRIRESGKDSKEDQDEKEGDDKKKKGKINQ